MIPDRKVSQKTLYKTSGGIKYQKIVQTQVGSILMPQR